MARNLHFLKKIKKYFSPIFIILLMFTFSLSAYQLNRPGFGNFMEPPKAEKGTLKIAGMNVKMQSITDHPNNIDKFPKYQWKYRIIPLISLIEKDAPDVLALSETTFTQIQDLERSLSDYSYQGFCSVSNQSYRNVSVTALDSEFIGFLFNSKKLNCKPYNSMNWVLGKNPNES